MSPTDPPPESVCPSADEIRAILLGRGAAGAPDRFARHLVACPRCAAAVDAMSVDTLVIDALRSDPLPVPPSADELADVATRLSRISRPSRPSRVFPEPAVAGAAVAAVPPESLGPYRLMELLGTGGMGVVYRAEDTDLRRFVALKLLKPGADQDERYRERFLREARAVAAVKNDHIVTVFQVGEAATGGKAPVPFLAMELLDGESLHDWMRVNPRPPVSWAVRIGRQAAAGLAAAHARGLIHRDVKPANLWLETPPGWAADPPDRRPPFGAVARVKLLDFGLARPTEEWAGSDAVSGTPGYMAPEQARGDRLDGRADLFGLGCVLYELCAGGHPFPGRVRGWSNEPGDPPPPVNETNPDVPAPLAALIGRLLSRDPADRPGSAREVERELAALETETGGPATLTDRAAETVADAPPRSKEPGRRGLRTAIAAGGSVALLATAVAAWSVATSGPAETASTGQETPATSPTDSARADGPPFPDGPPDEQWCRQAAERPPKVQFGLVAQKMGEVNPGYDWKRATGWVEPELVIRFTVKSNAVHDLRPLRGLPDLKNVGVEGVPPENGILTDLSPLAGLRLQVLRVPNQPRLRDLTPLKGSRLAVLSVAATGVESLEPLAGLPLTDLNVSKSRVKDLSPVRSMPNLQIFRCDGCPVGSLEPLADTPIQKLWADIRTDADAAVVRRMPRLEQVNGKPAEEVGPVTK